MKPHRRQPWPSELRKLPPNLIRRMHLRMRTPAQWMKSFAKIEDEAIRSHVARLVWWDIISAEEGEQPTATGDLLTLMEAWPEQTHRQKEVKAALIRVGYYPSDAAARATPANETGVKARTCEGFRQV